LGRFFKRLSFLAFLLGSVILDIEPLFVIIYNRNYSYYSYPHHGILHSLFGAFFTSLLIAMILNNFKNFFTKFKMGLFSKFIPSKEEGFLGLFFSAFLGCALHLLFDSFMHYDVFPFWPSRFNPFLGLISNFQNYFLCSILGILGIILLICSLLAKKSSAELNIFKISKMKK